jgi:uncharacterized alkaline shock family protein YloU
MMISSNDKDVVLAQDSASGGVAQVSDDVFVSIAKLCVAEIDGVSRLTMGPSRGLKGFLRGVDPAGGVRVEKLDKMTDDRIVMDVHIVIEQDAAIPAVCAAIQDSLKDTIEMMLDKEVAQVNVYVQDIEGSASAALPETVTPQEMQMIDSDSPSA